MRRRTSAAWVGTFSVSLACAWILAVQIGVLRAAHSDGETAATQKNALPTVVLRPAPLPANAGSADSRTQPGP